MIKINLLPHKKVKAVEKGVLQLRIIAVAVTILVAVGLIYWFFLLHGKSSELAEKEQETTQQLESLKKTVKEVEGYEKSRKELEEKFKIIQELQKKRVPVSAVLSELNLHTTKDIWFTSLSISNASFSLEGMARDSKANAEAFYDRLKGSNVFYEVDMVDLKEDSSSGRRKFAFKITGKVSGFEQAAATPQGKAVPAAVKGSK